MMSTVVILLWTFVMFWRLGAILLELRIAFVSVELGARRRHYEQYSRVPTLITARHLVCFRRSDTNTIFYFASLFVPRAP